MKNEFKKIIEKGKQIIKIILNNGYEAYFTGKTVRNILLDSDIEDVEISTNSPLETIEYIFLDFSPSRVDKNMVSVRYENDVFYIRRFQSEYRKNKKEKPLLKETDNVIDDLKTKTFSLDAMAININGKITDVYDGYRDINRKKIRITSLAKIRLLNDPLLALETMALVSELGFGLDYNSFKAIRRCKLLKNIKLEEMLPYIDRIISGKYIRQAIFYINKTKIYKYIPIFGLEFRAQNIKFQKIDHDMIICKALVRNGEIDDDVLDLCKKKEEVKSAIDLAIVTPKSQYDPILLFNYGLKNVIFANQINTLLGRTTKKTRKIEKEYDLLPIKKVCDLKYKGEDILKSFPDIESDLLIEVVEEIKYKVIMQELANDYEEIKAFALTKIDKSSIKENDFEKVLNVKEFSFKENNSNVEVLDKEKFIKENAYAFKNDEKIADIEKRMEEYERRLQEKDKKINALEKNNLYGQLSSDLETFMMYHYEAMEKLSIYGLDKERISREIKNAYKEILIENLEKYKRLRDEENE